jgi:endonuclease-8
MPEGPQVARYARRQLETLAGRAVRVDSPDGRSDEVAALLDGRTLHGIEAIGKHLVYDFGDGCYLHVHLGRFGQFTEGRMPLPEPRGTLRFRMHTESDWYELRGAIAIDVYDETMRRALVERIGPNPLDPQADPLVAFARVGASEAPIAQLLMDQRVVAGIGNIYRSEILFLHGLHPRRPGSSVERSTWRAMWRDLSRLMRAAEESGRIVTTLARDRARGGAVVRRTDAFYVYRRTGLPCRRCGQPIRSAEMGNRTVFWCERDQPERGAVRRAARSQRTQRAPAHAP